MGLFRNKDAFLTLNGIKLKCRSAFRLKSFGCVHTVVMMGERNVSIPVDFAMDQKAADRIVKKLNRLKGGDYEYSREILPAAGTKAAIHVGDGDA